ncbi:MAG: hypothetical protein WDW36_007013 [Sanguina aurantia]
MESSLSGRILSGLKRKAPLDTEDAAGTSASKPPAPPRYQPWDQPSLHRRLDTYRPLTWFSKPASVGPVVCASRGWKNESRDTLCCEFCGSHLSYPRAVPHSMTQTAAEKFGEQLITSHLAMCPWRASPCAESVLAYKPVPKSDPVAEHHARLVQLQRLDLLPPVEPRALDDVLQRLEGGDQQSLMQLLAEVRGSDAAGGSSSAAGGRPVTVAQPPAAPAESAGDVTAVPPPTPSKQRLGLRERAALLALCGWELQIVAPESNSTVQSLTHTASYGLSHLISSPVPKRRKSSVHTPAPATPAPATAVAAGSSTAGSGSLATTPAAKQVQRPTTVGPDNGMAAAGEPVSMLNAVLSCSHCHSRVGLWSYSGLRPSTLGRFQPPAPEPPFSTPRSGNTPSATTPRAATLPPTPGADAAHSLSPAPAAGFSFGSSSSRSAAFGLQALGPSSIPSSPLFTPSKPHTVAEGRAGPASNTGQSTQVPAGVQQAGCASAAAAPPQPSIAAPLGSPLQPAPSAGPGPAGAFAAPALAAAREPFDPLRHHRSWCPWVYTGATSFLPPLASFSGSSSKNLRGAAPDSSSPTPPQPPPQLRNSSTTIKHAAPRQTQPGRSTLLQVMHTSASSTSKLVSQRGGSVTNRTLVVASTSVKPTGVLADVSKDKQAPAVTGTLFKASCIVARADSQLGVSPGGIRPSSGVSASGKRTSLAGSSSNDGSGNADNSSKRVGQTASTGRQSTGVGTKPSVAAETDLAAGSSSNGSGGRVASRGSVTLGAKELSSPATAVASKPSSRTTRLDLAKETPPASNGLPGPASSNGATSARGALLSATSHRKPSVNAFLSGGTIASSRTLEDLRAAAAAAAAAASFPQSDLLNGSAGQPAGTVAPRFNGTTHRQPSTTTSPPSGSGCSGGGGSSSRSGSSGGAHTESPATASPASADAAGPTRTPVGPSGHAAGGLLGATPPRPPPHLPLSPVPRGRQGPPPSHNAQHLPPALSPPPHLPPRPPQPPPPSIPPPPPASPSPTVVMPSPPPARTPTVPTAPPHAHPGGAARAQAGPPSRPPLPPVAYEPGMVIVIVPDGGPLAAQAGRLVPRAGHRFESYGGGGGGGGGGGDGDAGVAAMQWPGARGRMREEEEEERGGEVQEQLMLQQQVRLRRERRAAAAAEQEGARERMGRDIERVMMLQMLLRGAAQGDDDSGQQAAMMAHEEERQLNLALAMSLHDSHPAPSNAHTSSSSSSSAYRSQTSAASGSTSTSSFSSSSSMFPTRFPTMIESSSPFSHGMPHNMLTHFSLDSSPPRGGVFPPDLRNQNPVSRSGTFPPDSWIQMRPGDTEPHPLLQLLMQQQQGLSSAMDAIAVMQRLHMRGGADGGAGGVGWRGGNPVEVMTYESLSQLEDVRVVAPVPVLDALSCFKIGRRPSETTPIASAGASRGAGPGVPKAALDAAEG